MIYVNNVQALQHPGVVSEDKTVTVIEAVGISHPIFRDRRKMII